ncbi:MAG: alpha/beta fold hydrolase [Saprospiraceae bacterium]
MKLNYFLLLFILIFNSCVEDDFTLSSEAGDFFFFKNKNAKMPVAVQGNTASKTFVILLNGGPGGSSFSYNELFGAMTNSLEEDFGMVYWEQRNSGATQGVFDDALMTPSQYVEDLEQLVELIRFHYGVDIQVFLMGVSWGGYLGYAYLSEKNNQSNITGFVNVVGPHNLPRMTSWSKKRLIETAQNKLNMNSNNASDWQKILNWCVQKDTILNKDDFMMLGNWAMEAELLEADSLSMEMKAADWRTQLNFIFGSPFSAGQLSANQNSIAQSQLLDIALKENLDDYLPNIKVPVTIFGGAFDYVVPIEVLSEQYDLLGSSEKELIIFEKSGHRIISNETTRFIREIKLFIDKNR